MKHLLINASCRRRNPQLVCSIIHGIMSLQLHQSHSLPLLVHGLAALLPPPSQSAAPPSIFFPEICVGIMLYYSFDSPVYLIFLYSLLSAPLHFYSFLHLNLVECQKYC
ncbi:hypothetical protein RDI58_016530 [Solanum bulbocastanum]|uniref:Uncharacterized protein n=1 Tax=Solanum bulbocastanum TaxID=147425 RepID=A0AAN8YCG7_SOLBU